MSKKEGGSSVPKKNWRDSVQTSLILTMSILVAVPLVIAMSISYESSIKKSLQDAKDSNYLQAQIVEDAFLTSINQQMRTLEAVAEITCLIFQKESILRQLLVAQNVFPMY